MAVCATGNCEVENVLTESAWRNRSFFLEMKPRGDFASVFLDCPLPICGESITDGDASKIEEKEFIKVGCNSLEIHDSFEKDGNVKFAARIADLRISPNSISGVSWADVHRRLFMCKVHVNADDDIGFPRKSFRNFEEELRTNASIGECVEELLDAFEELKVSCRHCRSVLHSHMKSEMDFDVLPEDDWLETSPSMEYFCGQSCGHGHFSNAHLDEPHEHFLDHEPHHQRHNFHPYYQGLLGIPSAISTSGNGETAHNISPINRWLPNASKIVFSNSFLILLSNDNLKKTIEYSESQRILTCRQCATQVGIPLRADSRIYKLHVGAVEISGDGPFDGEISSEVPDVSRDYITSRFKSFEKYFAWMFLYKSESQSSMKLLIRSYDRKPFLLVWLLEPYVIMVNGVLQSLPRSEKQEKDNVEKEDNGDDGNENLPPQFVKHNSYVVLNSQFGNQNVHVQEEARPFSALKVLYKLYDEQSAAA